MHSVFLHYPIRVPIKQVTQQPYTTYQDQSAYYFIIPGTMSEQAAVEMYSIASHYHQYGWTNVACPIQNIHNQWITSVGKDKYILCVASKGSERQDEAQMLARFQQTGFTYPYQPSEINNYGQWKQLWANKVDQYELLYQQLYQQRPTNSMIREFVNFFPYIVGIAENAIQYMNSVEQERQFSEQDQPTITFGRYHGEVTADFIYCNHFIYDHSVRDLAEKLRPFLLEQEGLQDPECYSFLRSYLGEMPLSPFGWKLLYARLIFPIHLFDWVDQIRQSPQSATPIKQMIEYQKNYQRHLKTFFYQLGIDERELNSIQLDWI
ncbi:protein kinase family protein [Gracilibacillus alcaliphilus]|uniref:hypothetical protein n=1 Tax=Gracilibacillus alcaliphilus TaxID=1401441 RepID=UPI0019567ACE|nr:hypothetical protein [Gracilibacillus alcaliphilus]MBM7675889.1 spore coat protein YutH [Gracilibacillus alcaliphilus]